MTWWAIRVALAWIDGLFGCLLGASPEHASRGLNALLAARPARPHRDLPASYVRPTQPPWE